MTPEALRQYRAKPIVVEAVQYDGTLPLALLAFLTQDEQIRNGSRDGALEIRTLGGTLRVNIGEWIIRGMDGELSSCKPGIFGAMYEPAETPTPEAWKVVARCLHVGAGADIRGACSDCIALALAEQARAIEQATWEAAMNIYYNTPVSQDVGEIFRARGAAQQGGTHGA